MFKFYFGVCSLLIFLNGCLSETPENLIFKANGPNAELLHKIYLKSVEWHALIDNKFYEVHSNLSRVILDVNSNTVVSLIKGIEKLDILRGQVKAFLDSRETENQDCLNKVSAKMDKLLFKIGTKISDCAVLADQQIQAITNRKIELGGDILEVSEMLLSGTLMVISDHFASGRSFDDLPDIRDEYEEDFEQANDEIYEEILPNIVEELMDIREEALDIPSTIEMCVNNVLLKLNNVVGDTGKLTERCNAD